MNATTERGSADVKAEKFVDWAISNQAARTAEGSEIIPSGSRGQAAPKCATTLVVEDMTRPTVRAVEIERKRLGRNTRVGAAVRRHLGARRRADVAGQPSVRDGLVGLRSSCAGDRRLRRGVSRGTTNLENCWNSVRAAGTTTWGGSPSVTVENSADSPISSRAARTAEGSTTIAKASRDQAVPKPQAPARGEDIVWTSVKAEEAECKRFRRNEIDPQARSAVVSTSCVRRN